MIQLVQRSTPDMKTPEAEPGAGLPAVARLFQELNQAHVRYCHWKSNVRLEEALNGQTDLDLLVDPKHSEQFRQILQQQGLKALRAAPGKAYPGVENYLGFDRASGGLFHLHVHYRLILGEQFVKNYVLPLREPFLDSVELEKGVRIPTPEMELIVFCARALLKYRDRDALKDVLGIRSPGLSAAILKEVQWLRSRATPDRVDRRLQELGNVIPASIVLSFLEVTNSRPRDGSALLRLRTGLRKALRPYRRRSQLHASLTYFRELWFRRRSRMQLQAGGHTLALVGADGAGKSTMCKMLQQWLSWKVDVRLFYLGSKKPSRRSQMLYLLFRMLRRSQRSTARLLGEENIMARWLTVWRQSLLYSHKVSLAMDRYRRFRAAQRLAKSGTLVIYDRFPLAPRLDGAKIRHLAGEDFTRVAKRFSRREEAIYETFAVPEHMFLLDVTPDVSLARKPDHERAAIEAKYETLQTILASGRPRLVPIDANQDMRDVVSQLKETVWQVL